MSKITSVAVIGAGISGLSCIKTLARAGFEVTCFEQSPHVGGVWSSADPRISPAARGYETLHTNTNRSTTELSDFPFSITADDQFPTLDQMERYMKDYCRHFQLERHIRFNTTVIACENSGADGWLLKTRSRGEESEQTQSFDGLLVCSGRTSTPADNGCDGFQGEILHSAHFRSASQLRGKRVFIRGRSISAHDVIKALLAAPGCGTTIWVETDDIADYQGVRSLAGPLRFRESSIEAADGTVVPIDVIVACTGYSYRFPFLPEEVSQELKIQDRPARMELFNHTFLPGRRSLAFIAMCSAFGSTHPIAEAQAEYVKRIWQHSQQLPPPNKMRDAIFEWKRTWFCPSLNPTGEPMRVDPVRFIIHILNTPNDINLGWVMMPFWWAPIPINERPERSREATDRNSHGRIHALEEITDIGESEPSAVLK